MQTSDVEIFNSRCFLSSYTEKERQARESTHNKKIAEILLTLISPDVAARVPHTSRPTTLTK